MFSLFFWIIDLCFLSLEHFKRSSSKYSKWMSSVIESVKAKLKIIIASSCSVDVDVKCSHVKLDTRFHCHDYQFCYLEAPWNLGQYFEAPFGVERTSSNRKLGSFHFRWAHVLFILWSVILGIARVLSHVLYTFHKKNVHVSLKCLEVATKSSKFM